MRLFVWLIRQWQAIFITPDSKLNSRYDYKLYIHRMYKLYVQYDVHYIRYWSILHQKSTLWKNIVVWRDHFSFLIFVNNTYFYRSFKYFTVNAANKLYASIFFNNLPRQIIIISFMAAQEWFSGVCGMLQSCQRSRSRHWFGDSSLTTRRSNTIETTYV